MKLQNPKPCDPYGCSGAIPLLNRLANIEERVQEGLDLIKEMGQKLDNKNLFLLIEKFKEIGIIAETARKMSQK